MLAAIQSGDLSRVQAILAADPPSADAACVATDDGSLVLAASAGVTPLALAASMGLPDLVQVLLRAGDNKPSCGRQLTPLMLALRLSAANGPREGRSACARALLDSGAEPDCRDAARRTALFYAVEVSLRGPTPATRCARPGTFEFVLSFTGCAFLQRHIWQRVLWRL
jgi:ankyrin repeat protein